jgi:hypothetical protein
MVCGDLFQGPALVPTVEDFSSHITCRIPFLPTSQYCTDKVILSKYFPDYVSAAK